MLYQENDKEIKKSNNSIYIYYHAQHKYVKNINDKITKNNKINGNNFIKEKNPELRLYHDYYEDPKYTILKEGDTNNKCRIQEDNLHQYWINADNNNCKETIDTKKSKNTIIKIIMLALIKKKILYNIMERKKNIWQKLI